MRAIQKTITVWPTEAVSMLQDCFETAEWQMFKEAATEGDTVNLEKYTKSVLGYIEKCVEDVTITKPITIPPNQKPWLNAKVHRLLEPNGGSQESKVNLCSKNTGSFLISRPTEHGEKPIV